MAENYGKGRVAWGCLKRVNEAKQVLKTRDDVVLGDALPQESMLRDAAGEDGDEPHPPAAGGIDIRIPIPDVEGVRTWDRKRSKNGLKRLGVRLRMSVFPCASRRKPLGIHADGTEAIGERLAIIRGTERHRDLVAAEPLDGLQASLDCGIGVLALNGVEACHKLLLVSLAERWPPGLNRLCEVCIALALAAAYRREIVSNGLCGQVKLCRRGLEMRCEAGHEIQDNAVNVENQQLQWMTKQLH